MTLLTFGKFMIDLSHLLLTFFGITSQQKMHVIDPFIASALSIEPVFAGDTRAASTGIDFRNASLTNVSFIHRLTGGDASKPLDAKDATLLAILEQCRLISE